jgi:pyrimidine-nucleoside phosphorylase/thymidine phosphorylase
MRTVDLIREKRDGKPLRRDEIAHLVRGIATREVADYQWAALLMAIVWRGMNNDETTALTEAMLHSGTLVDLSDIPGLKVDKHSTGGVGDKTSLILAPVAAACGVPVPMVSGRGLGHAGGTLDKLESIPGFNVQLDLREYKRILAQCGFVLIGQTDEIAPADRFLYALRDATATVESIPLITASILSKKLAEGIDGLVLDVKMGHGAYIEAEADARRLANSLCTIGRGLSKRVVALLTRMDQPLGRAVGNALEVEEAIGCLRGEGPDDLRGLSLDLAAEMLVLGQQAASLEDARRKCAESIQTGAALDRLRAVIAAQGGDPRVVDDPRLLARAPIVEAVRAPRSGYVTKVAARTIGAATMRLGAGRARVDSTIDHSVGVLLHKKVGDAVTAGETLCVVHARTRDSLQRACAEVLQAYAIGENPLIPPALVVDRI